MGDLQDFRARKVVGEVAHFPIPNCNPVSDTKKHFKTGSIAIYLSGIFQNTFRIWHRF